VNDLLKVERRSFFISCSSQLWLIFCIFTNLIPPIPLSLKDAGVYHSLYRNSDGNYTATEEPQTFWDFFKSYKLFHEVAGQPVYVFTSIFAPTNLNVQVIHDWQHYDETSRKWQSIEKMSLSIIGGRDGGFRTYSIMTVSQSGLWRVDVTTLKRPAHWSSKISS